MSDSLKKIEKLREYMCGQGLDAILVDSWQNVLYCSGFTGYGDAVLLITRKGQFIVTDSRYYVQAGVQCPDYTLVKSGARAFGAMMDLLTSENVKVLGYEEKAIGYKAYLDYYSKLGVELVSVSDVIFGMRVMKSPEEIARLAESCDLAADALARTFPYIKAGVTEMEIAARLEYEMRLAGAEKTSFDTIVASGVRGSMPHGTASPKVVENGDGVTIDFGAFYKGMCSDETRTVFVGEPSAEMRKIYSVVLEAQLAVIDGYRPGMTGRELDKAARDVIAAAGFGEYFGHSLGHGVGIDVHEGVSVSPSSDLVLEPGMVFSLEPGIYVPGMGGVRIEDLGTIVDGRIRILTKGPDKALTIL